MAKLTKSKLASFAKKIHTRAKSLRAKDNNKKAYKQYVSLASAELRKENAFK